MDRDHLPGDPRRQLRDLGLPARDPARVPGACRALREPGAADRDHPHRAALARCRADRRVAYARRQQHLHPDRVHGAGGARCEERDPDRGIRARAGIRRPDSGAGGDRGEPAAAAADRPDFDRLHHGCAAARPFGRGRRGDAPGDGHRGVRRHDRGYRVRYFPHPGVLRAATRADRQSAAQAPRRDCARGGRISGRRRAGEPGVASDEAGGAMKFLSALLVLLLTACATSLPKIEQEKLPQPPQAFKEGDGRWAQAPPAEAQPRGEWWKAFSDPVLDDLVERANRSNTSIQLAAARLAQARAFVRTTDADRSPQIGVGASAARAQGIVGGVAVTTPRNILATGVDFSYEVDLFGRLSHATDAATLDAQAQAGLLQSARLLVQAQVAQTYLALRALDAERSLVRSTVGAYRETLTLTERRWRAGDVAELDVARASTEVAAPESDALALDRQRAELEHALAVLVGEVVSSFSLPVAEWNSALPVIPAGLPSTLLTRRPDVSAAQQGMLAAQARVGVAKAAYFPRVALTGTAGYASTDLSDLLQWSSRAWLLGAVASLPVFDGGRRKAGIESASAQLEGDVARYREQVLVAFKDVEDQLSGLRLLSEQAEAQGRAVQSSSRSTALSDVRYRSGYVSQLDLLDAQRSELRNRRQGLQVRSAQYQSAVALVRALGGGWD